MQGYKFNKASIYLIILFLCIVGIFIVLFFKWQQYLGSIETEKVYFEDTFSSERTEWKALDAQWKSEDNEATGIFQLSRKNYAAPYMMTVLPLNQSPDENFVCHIRVKPTSFTNSSVVLASFIFSTDPITIIMNDTGQLGIARSLFEAPVYSDSKINLSENEWHDLYVYVSHGNKSISVYLDKSHVLDKDLIGETYPLQEIWLGAIWLNGGGNYGSPRDISYDSISLGNNGLLPKPSFKNFIFNLF